MRKIEYDGEDRTEVARATLRIVAKFVGDSESDLIKQGSAEECEARVAELAEEAQGNTISHNGRPAAIVMEVLQDHFLADDFMRMARGDQAAAFEPGGSRIDVCRNCGAPRDY